MENPIFRWLKSTAKIINQGDEDREVTHYLMNGGKVDLSKDYDIFQELYARLCDECKNSIVEKKTNIFPFFIDFDVLTLEHFDITPYIKNILSTMFRIYKEYNFCLVTKANCDKYIDKDNKRYIKIGFHFHWPNIMVNKNTANVIRDNIVVGLTNEFGKPDIFYDNWRKIIDKCVYDQNGLRLLWSDKCKKSDDVWEYENRVYIVYKVFTNLEEDVEMTNNLKENKLLALRYSSVRSDAKEITKYFNLDNYEITEEKEETYSSYIRIKEGTLEYDAIKKFFSIYVEPKGYKWNQIAKVLKQKDKEIYILESRSRYCQNVGRRHENNHIYFKLTRHGICQKCHSESEGTYGCCRNYSSSLIHLPHGCQLITALGWKTTNEQLTSYNRNDNDYAHLTRDTLRHSLTNQKPMEGYPGFNSKK